ncbi:phosphatidylinositol-glycan biosynthesis class F protein [Leptidea sinapis]|uniref:phosphatidylinositol-glycan biosynthesis class F protein n=1 Tax=Leptidea sinapis TaxID=189913 RepID=UPI0021C33CEF|nr:phosphatidylinositol-glycan biosynthesis class F protein [Leptidea sinapis]
MFSLNDHLELRRVTVSSLVTCVYLPSIITVISYKGLLYSVGKASSFYILALIFVAELLKSFYLNSQNDIQQKKSKGKTKTGDLVKAFCFLLGITFCFFIGIILFGAPFLDNHEETLMLSCLLTLLAVFPLVAHIGVEMAMQLLFGVKSFTRDTIIAMLVNNAVFTLCGAWLGAVVIPLDWNTPWQVWPIPCYLGAVGGYLLANVLTVLKVSLMSASTKYKYLNFFVNILNKFHISK